MSGRLGISRRELLVGSSCVGLAALGGGFAATRAAAADMVLPIRKVSGLEIVPGTQTLDMMSFGDNGAPPVLRFKQGEELVVDVENQLGEASVVHWHGLRIDNRYDGVPYLTQEPVEDGQSFRYRVKSPDAGTYWYHPHCNTLEQMARGLTGVLIVEEQEDVGFDHDLPLNIRDFRMDGKGQFIDFYKPRLAARGGTLGTVSTINWQVAPVYEFPAGSLVRLRMAVTDLTRVGTYAVNGGVARVIALDSNPLPVPQPPEDILLAPGQRADVALQMPDQDGELVTLTRRTPSGQKVLMTLRAVGQSAGRKLVELKPLPLNPHPVPDLENAEVVEFLFGWTPESGPPIVSICGTLGYTFWSINRVAWEGDTPGPVEPLAVLRQGKSYILRFKNETPNDHPIHLHGMSFRLLRSNKRKLPPLITDTALLRKGETMEVALVADNPGNWAFHCHVIEHQKTGLTGYIRVEA
ncbi:MAG: multicopper oxidase family protein [Rhodobacteraceae bacterium]|nr:multicopper oxidase family protein [Paracoccaceae bacterium]